MFSYHHSQGKWTGPMPIGRKFGFDGQRFHSICFKICAHLIIRILILTHTNIKAVCMHLEADWTEELPIVRIPRALTVCFHRLGHLLANCWSNNGWTAWTGFLLVFLSFFRTNEILLSNIIKMDQAGLFNKVNHIQHLIGNVKISLIECTFSLINDFLFKLSQPAINDNYLGK